MSPPVRDRAAHCAQCARTGKLTQQCWLINGTSSGGSSNGGFFYNSTKVEQIIKKQCAKRTRTRGLDDSAPHDIEIMA